MERGKVEREKKKLVQDVTLRNIPSKRMATVVVVIVVIVVIVIVVVIRGFQSSIISAHYRVH